MKIIGPLIVWRLLCLIILSSPLLLEAKFITTFIPRSQGANTARELVGWQRQLYGSYNENYGAFSSVFEYTRSIDTRCIAEEFFSTNLLTFAGSESPERTNSDIIADYFGLPINFYGTLAIKPLIENVIIDLEFYFGLDEWLRGLYLRIHAPITYTKWTLGLNECLPCGDKFRGCTEFPTCYMTSTVPVTQSTECPEVVPPTRMPVGCPINTTLNIPNQYKNGNCTVQTIREALSGNFTFGDMVEPWNYGRFSFCPRAKAGLADIDVILGFNLFASDWGHLAFFGQVVVPTGDRPKGKYIFEPLVGNGRHWQAGGGLSAHLSAGSKGGNACGIYIEGNATHMFETNQIRSFDFTTNGLLSRYILLKEFTPEGEYDATFINAINFATRNCKVSIGLQVDASAKFFVAIQGWQLDIGYNAFYQEAETVCIHTACPCAIDSRIFGIKGLEGVCASCYTVENDQVQPGVTSMELLNTTQPDATMFTANLPTSAPVPESPTTICLSWNSEAIEEATNVNELIQDGFIVANTTEPATRVTCNDLDPSSAAQGRMFTNKFFGHLAYIFEKSCYSPHVGVGGEIELDGRYHNALQQWGVWLKAGLMF